MSSYGAMTLGRKNSPRRSKSCQGVSPVLFLREKWKDERENQKPNIIKRGGSFSFLSFILFMSSFVP